MKTFHTELLRTLIEQAGPLCLSIYIPMEKDIAAQNKNMLQLKNIIKEIRQQPSSHPSSAIDDLLKPIEKLLESPEEFRGHEGCIGLFSSSNSFFEWVKLPSCSDIVYYIDDTFYLLPFFELIEKNRSYHILSLGKNHVYLYEGNLYRLQQVELKAGIPDNMKAALGDDLTDNHLHAAAGGSATLHGYMEVTEEKEIDNSRFFRMIDSLIYEHYSKLQKYPLLLASLPENHHLFHSISKNEFLMPESLSANEGTDTSILLQQANELLAEDYQNQLNKLLDRALLAKQENLGHDDLSQVAKDALDGRIEHLFLEKGKIIPGKILVEERKIKTKGETDSDLLNKLALLSYKNSTKIHIVPPQSLTAKEGVMTINRF